MERKIGEVFEHKGEWYQCVEGAGCYQCAFNRDENACTDDNPHCTCRSDKKDVVFKKLEKVGEPYEFQKRIIQAYKLYTTPFISVNIDFVFAYFNGSSTIDIIIKQNKEDMEENKLNLKPFDIQKAREGKPVCTRDGRKARIICFDRDWDMHIVALVSDHFGESVHYYLSNGKVDFDKHNDEDLMMLPEKKEGWVNVYKERCYESKEEAIRHIAPGTHYIDTIRVEWEDKE